MYHVVKTRGYKRAPNNPNFYISPDDGKEYPIEELFGNVCLYNKTPNMYVNVVMKKKGYKLVLNMLKDKNTF
jgi:hypothetical protein